MTAHVQAVELVLWTRVDLNGARVDCAWCGETIVYAAPGHEFDRPAYGYHRQCTESVRQESARVRRELGLREASL